MKKKIVFVLLVFLVFVVSYFIYRNYFQFQEPILQSKEADLFSLGVKHDEDLEKKIDLAADFFQEEADVDLSMTQKKQKLSTETRDYNEECSRKVSEDLIEQVSLGKVVINVDEVSKGDFSAKKKQSENIPTDLLDQRMGKVSSNLDDIVPNKLEECKTQKNPFGIEEDVKVKKKLVVKKNKKVKAKRSSKKVKRKKPKKKVEKKVYYPLPEKNILFLKRLYNHVTVEYPWRKWIVSGAFHSSVAYDAFGDCGQEIPLGCLLFGNFKIKDIFLLSKLSDCGKLFRFESDTLYEFFKQIGREVCGYSREEQDLAYLAQYDVKICAERREKRVDVGGIYNFCIPGYRGITGAIGFNLPIRSVRHMMNVDILGVNFLNYDFTVKQIEDVIAQYDKSFIDLKDFFNRIILEPKGICLLELQNKFGVGDVSIFTLFDLANVFEHLDGFQLGAEMFFPISRTSNAYRIWDPMLGTGAYQFGFSGNILVKVTPYFNPCISLEAKFSLPFKSCRRVPKLKSQCLEKRVQAKFVDDLIVPDGLINPDYKDYWVEPFCEFDTCIKGFADEVFNTETNLGNVVEFNLGNYFYNVFETDFMINVFYEFSYKGKDKVRVVGTSGTYNTDLLESKTESTSHDISWAVSYIGKEGIEINFGSEHTIAGSNTPKDHEITASIVFAF